MDFELLAYVIIFPSFHVGCGSVACEGKRLSAFNLTTATVRVHTISKRVNSYNGSGTVARRQAGHDRYRNPPTHGAYAMGYFIPPAPGHCCDGHCMGQGALL